MLLVHRQQHLPRDIMTCTAQPALTSYRRNAQLGVHVEVHSHSLLDSSRLQDLSKQEPGLLIIIVMMLGCQGSSVVTVVDL